MAKAPRTRSAPTKAEEYARLEDFWDEPVPGPRPVHTDVVRLQGAWMSVLGRRRAEFLFSGNHVTVHFADGEIYMGSFTVKSGQPSTMDVRVVEGPARHKGLVALCIYELDGDVLRWCTASPGQTQRPTAFVEHDPQHLCLVFRREHVNGQC